jgi:hypothetical protein
LRKSKSHEDLYSSQVIPEPSAYDKDDGENDKAASERMMAFGGQAKIKFPMAAENSLYPPSGRPVIIGRERAVSQAVSNFDLFQLDGRHS